VSGLFSDDFARYSLQKAPVSHGIIAPKGASKSAKNFTNGLNFDRDTFFAILSICCTPMPVELFACLSSAS